MPVYEYQCATCGPFEAIAPMSRFADPCNCPICSASSPRVMLTAPNVAVMNPAKRIAHATNERSADSPRRSSQGPGVEKPAGAKFGSRALQRSDGSRSYPASRPWMLSH